MKSAEAREEAALAGGNAITAAAKMIRMTLAGMFTRSGM